MSIFFNGRQYASRDSARVSAWKLAHRAAWYRSRDDSNKRYPGKRRVRKAVQNAVKHGRLVAARLLPCFDCRKPADQYDHFKSYYWADRFCIQAVCRKCSMKRDFKRGRR